MPEMNEQLIDLKINLIKKGIFDNEIKSRIEHIEKEVVEQNNILTIKTMEIEYLRECLDRGNGFLRNFTEYIQCRINNYKANLSQIFNIISGYFFFTPNFNQCYV